MPRHYSWAPPGAPLLDRSCFIPGRPSWQPASCSQMTERYKFWLLNLGQLLRVIQLEPFLCSNLHSSLTSLTAQQCFLSPAVSPNTSLHGIPELSVCFWETQTGQDTISKRAKWGKWKVLSWNDLQYFYQLLCYFHWLIDSLIHLTNVSCVSSPCKMLPLFLRIEILYKQN
jgi:hypothetical protein